MTVISTPHAYDEPALFVDLKPGFDIPLHLKVEGFNFAGSVKIKAAAEMVERAEREGLLHPDSILIESSSGNLGVALSVIAADRGYPFVCVVDPRCNLATRQLMETYGARVHQVTRPDPENGFLGARLEHVRRLCDSDPRYLWLNQYANPGNWQAHHRRTGPEILREFPDLDVLFVGAGTTGTLMGCARFFAEQARRVHVVAVDVVGSVTFGGPPARRMIPGLGTSVRPPQLDASIIDEVVMVAEPDTVRTCHRLARRGFLFGGSTGTVVSGASAWLARHAERGGAPLTTVGIAPDFGERYLDTLYHANWVADIYGDDVLPPEPGHASRISA
ncbi:2,3-diaminopropionate biosynthesis protein SbnA [Agilicoccus flavus]|uniref:2,3-diaminopropionate biosynthesis protein SbnA n=1 Tax=Agilicoccus flavus TaxID=2775968 RepID=UPI001CF71226|nr:2,3-diaminopropionate biosynthesis protein SbnA [Agilicoccus flavus]